MDRAGGYDVARYYTPGPGESRNTLASITHLAALGAGLGLSWIAGRRGTTGAQSHTSTVLPGSDIPYHSYGRSARFSGSRSFNRRRFYRQPLRRRRYFRNRRRCYWL